MDSNGLKIRVYPVQPGAWAPKNSQAEIVRIPQRTCESGETWRPVAGYPYEVSSLGRIRHTGKAQVLRPDRRKGYLTVSIGRRPSRNKMLHLLVAGAFLGPCPEGHEVDHKDGDKGNARADNLEYVTHAENQRRAIALGLQVSARGTRHGQAKLTEDQAGEILQLRPSGQAVFAMAARFGVHINTVYRVLRGDNWRHLLPAREAA